MTESDWSDEGDWEDWEDDTEETIKKIIVLDNSFPEYINITQKDNFFILDIEFMESPYKIKFFIEDNKLTNCKVENEKYVQQSKKILKYLQFVTVSDTFIMDLYLKIQDIHDYFNTHCLLCEKKICEGNFVCNDKLCFFNISIVCKYLLLDFIKNNKEVAEFLFYSFIISLHSSRKPYFIPDTITMKELIEITDKCITFDEILKNIDYLEDIMDSRLISLFIWIIIFCKTVSYNDGKLCIKEKDFDKKTIENKRLKRKKVVTRYHGTSPENLFNIINIGLKNYSKTNKQTNGAAYGSGIYLSDSSDFARGYSNKNIQLCENNFVLNSKYHKKIIYLKGDLYKANLKQFEKTYNITVVPDENAFLLKEIIME